MGLKGDVPGGHSTGLFSMTSGEEKVSEVETGAGCSAKIASFWVDMLGGVGDSE